MGPMCSTDLLALPHWAAADGSLVGTHIMPRPTTNSLSQRISCSPSLCNCSRVTLLGVAVPSVPGDWEAEPGSGASLGCGWWGGGGLRAAAWLCRTCPLHGLVFLSEPHLHQALRGGRGGFCWLAVQDAAAQPAQHAHPHSHVTPKRAALCPYVCLSDTISCPSVEDRTALLPLPPRLTLLPGSKASILLTRHRPQLACPRLCSFCTRARACCGLWSF